MNVSLARIMYGTNQDLNAPHSMNAEGVPSLRNQTIGSGAAGKAAASTLGGLGCLLHKAWAALRPKD
jgi:hypothetical protein